MTIWKSWGMFGCLTWSEGFFLNLLRSVTETYKAKNGIKYMFYFEESSFDGKLTTNRGVSDLVVWRSAKKCLNRKPIQWSGCGVRSTMMIKIQHGYCNFLLSLALFSLLPPFSQCSFHLFQPPTFLSGCNICLFQWCSAFKRAVCLLLWV